MTKGMRVNTSNIQKFRLEETEIEEGRSFVNLGSVVSVNGGTEEDVASRIKKVNGGCICSTVSCMEKSQHIKRT